MRADGGIEHRSTPARSDHAEVAGPLPPGCGEQDSEDKAGDDNLQFHGQFHGCVERKRPPVRFLLASGSRFANSLVPRLEGDSKPQPDGPAAVDTLLGEC